MTYSAHLSRLPLYLSTSVLLLSAAPSAFANILDQIPTGSPALFIQQNIDDFDKATEDVKRKFQSRFGGVCPIPNPPEDEDKKKKKQPPPPEPPQPPPPGPPNPPKPKFRPDGVVITPSGDSGDKILIELLEAEGEATITTEGFNPLDVDQVRSQFAPTSAGASAAAAVAAVNATFTATVALGGPPGAAYFYLNPATGQITVLPTSTGENFRAGTDNASDAFFFPVAPMRGIIPAITPGLSQIFPVGTSYTGILQDTGTGDRLRVTVTVTLTSVNISVTKL